MGTSIRRSALWIMLAALAIAAIALFAGGVGATPGLDAGAPAGPCNNGAALADGAFTGTDNSPDCVDGNVQEGGPSCLALGFPGALELNRSPADNASDAYVSGTLVGSGLYLDITAGANVNVLGAVIKGGSDANLYWGDLEGLHSPLSNAGSIPAISHWTVCYEIEEEPDPYKIKIVKDQVGGPVDTLFDFNIECSADQGPIGVHDPVSVYGGGTSDIIEIPAEYDRCTVTEVFDTGDGERWATLVGQGLASGRELTLDLDPEGVTVFYFENTYRPEPETASVWVTKKFEGPEDWKFGFAFICTSYGNADTFVLGGGESAHFDIPFFKQQVLVAEENGEHDGLLCGVAEEALPGAWTVNVSVEGASDSKTATEGGASALFPVYPGDAITVTFENIPGYGAQPPTGIPPVLATDVS